VDLQCFLCSTEKFENLQWNKKCVTPITKVQQVTEILDITIQKCVVRCVKLINCDSYIRFLFQMLFYSSKNPKKCIMAFTEIFSSTSLFNIGNYKKYFLSTESAY